MARIRRNAKTVFVAAFLLLLLFFLFTNLGQRVWLSGLMLPDLLPGSRIRPLEWVTRKPHVRQVEIPFANDVLRADLYLPARPGASSNTVLVVHGANQHGKDDVRIVNAGQTFARAGVVTLVPHFPDITPQRLTIRAREEIVSAFLWMARQFPAGRHGMIAFSLGSGPMLLAAADERIRHRIDYLVSFGGYYELKEVLRQAASGASCDPYGFWVAGQLLANLFAADESLQRLLENRDPAQFDVLFEKLSPAVRQVLSDLTLAGKLEPILARKIFLLHSESDPLIPVSETIRLRQALGPKAEVIILRGFSHVTPQFSTPTCKDVSGLYVPEFVKLYKVTFSILNL